ncbi:MAG: hypothetical protein F6K24_57860 [Okeania sp. SIO2D1]|nr:hypothetical protein [Okeania sp. SIO2D1]
MSMISFQEIIDSIEKLSIDEQDSFPLAETRGTLLGRGCICGEFLLRINILRI